MSKIITYSSSILNEFVKFLVIQNNPNLTIYIWQSNHSVGHVVHDSVINCHILFTLWPLYLYFLLSLSIVIAHTSFSLWCAGRIFQIQQSRIIDICNHGSLQQWWHCCYLLHFYGPPVYLWWSCQPVMTTLQHIFSFWSLIPKQYPQMCISNSWSYFKNLTIYSKLFSVAVFPLYHSLFCITYCSSSEPCLLQKLLYHTQTQWKRAISEWINEKQFGRGTITFQGI